MGVVGGGDGEGDFVLTGKSLSKRLKDFASQLLGGGGGHGVPEL